MLVIRFPSSLFFGKYFWLGLFSVFPSNFPNNSSLFFAVFPVGGYGFPGLMVFLIIIMPS